MTFFKFLFDKGHITERGSDVLAIAGIAITWGCAYFFNEWEGFWFWLLISAGVVIAYIGIYGRQAKQFGFQAPFTNDPLGWRKAKQSYKSPEDADKSVKKDAQP
jgi:hypothetical protein